MDAETLVTLIIGLATSVFAGGGFWVGWTQFRSYKVKLEMEQKRHDADLVHTFKDMVKDAASEAVNTNSKILELQKTVYELQTSVYALKLDKQKLEAENAEATSRITMLETENASLKRRVKVLEEVLEEKKIPIPNHTE